MTERDIFLSAIEISDTKEREKFVSEQCGADSHLRKQVDALLQAERESWGD